MERKNQAHFYRAAIVSPVRVTSFVKTQAAGWIGLAEIRKRNYVPFTGPGVFVEFEFCSLTLTGSLMIQIIQDNFRGFLNIYLIMNWAHNEDDYYFCLGINLNFGVSEIFEIHAILHLNRACYKMLLMSLALPSPLQCRWHYGNFIGGGNWGPGRPFHVSTGTQK